VPGPLVEHNKKLLCFSSPVAMSTGTMLSHHDRAKLMQPQENTCRLHKQTLWVALPISDLYHYQYVKHWHIFGWNLFDGIITQLLVHHPLNCLHGICLFLILTNFLAFLSFIDL